MGQVLSGSKKFDLTQPVVLSVVPYFYVELDEYSEEHYGETMEVDFLKVGTAKTHSRTQKLQFLASFFQRFMKKERDYLFNKAVMSGKVRLVGEASAVVPPRTKAPVVSMPLSFEDSADLDEGVLEDGFHKLTWSGDPVVYMKKAFKLKNKTAARDVFIGFRLTPRLTQDAAAAAATV